MKPQPLGSDGRKRYRSEREELQDAMNMWPPDSARWREHKFVGGPPPKRIYHMQIAHEVRARKLGLVWDIVDLRVVYEQCGGLCGICAQPVSREEFQIDHIIPVSKRGPHLLENLQIAHAACNSSKGAR